MIVVGIEPALKLAAQKFPGGTVGVLATPVTLREEKFQKLVISSSNHCEVVKLPAPGLADLVEAGKADSPEAVALLQPLLAPWVGKLDALVLGCTHYPFATAAIRRIVGDALPLLDGGEGTARETYRRLAEKNLLFDGPGELIWENSSRDEAMVTLCRTLLEDLE